MSNMSDIISSTTCTPDESLDPLFEYYDVNNDFDIVYEIGRAHV